MRLRLPWRKRQEPDTLARITTWLGWFSYGLGVAQLLRPGSVNRLFGVPADNANNTLTQGIGLREIASGTGILLRPRTTPWLWFRTAGDVMDLAVLGTVLRTGFGRRSHLVPAIAVISGIGALDLVTAVRMSTRSR